MVPSQLPIGRQYVPGWQDRLVVQDLAEEVLVYDLERHRAYCLNRAARFVWRRCDGDTPVAAIADALARETGLTNAEEIVWRALALLQRSHLVVDAPDRPRCSLSCTRRELRRQLGRAVIAAGLLPTILAISAPTPAQAGSCTPAGQPCTLDVQCCNGVCMLGTCL